MTVNTWANMGLKKSVARGTQEVRTVCYSGWLGI